MLEDYYYTNGYYVKKATTNSGEKGKKKIEWFVKKIQTNPELMLNCKYCKKTFWAKEEGLDTDVFINHQNKCKIIKRGKIYPSNIRTRS